jgi:1,4-dihydroxy-2-naphthoyl-CoA hydrolase
MFIIIVLPNLLNLNFAQKRDMTFDKEKMLDLCNTISKNTLMETLEIKYIDAGEDFLVAQMPVNPRIHQPMGLLHGGASVALAESVGSAASMLLVNNELSEIRGIEISANHLRAKRTGMVTGTARIVHQGKSIHLWEIKITDENGKLISICKLTNMVLPKRKL